MTNEVITGKIVLEVLQGSDFERDLLEYIRSCTNTNAPITMCIGPHKIQVRGFIDYSRDCGTMNNCFFEINRYSTFNISIAGQ